jgi:hypothetical protein
MVLPFLEYSNIGFLMKGKLSSTKSVAKIHHYVAAPQKQGKCTVSKTCLADFP